MLSIIQSLPMMSLLEHSHPSYHVLTEWYYYSKLWFLVLLILLPQDVTQPHSINASICNVCYVFPSKAFTSDRCWILVNWLDWGQKAIFGNQFKVRLLSLPGTTHLWHQYKIRYMSETVVVILLKSVWHHFQWCHNYQWYDTVYNVL